ncbi:MAG: hypothetical protein RJA70_4261 [Pseudomonadota bacterium]
MFWQLVRSRRCRVLFRRQQVVAGCRIVDFLAPSLRLVVEVDGGYHQRTQQGDRARDKQLRAAGYTVLRVTAELVLTQPVEVRRLLLEAVQGVQG